MWKVALIISTIGIAVANPLPVAIIASLFAIGKVAEDSMK